LIRLWFAAGFFSAHAVFYSLSLLLIVFGAAVTRYRDTAMAWRARLVIYPILVNILFVNMRWVSPMINEDKMDAVLWGLDGRLFGGSLSIMMEPLVSPALTETLSFCYMFFMVYLFLSMIIWLLSNVSVARVFYSGLFSLYGVGYFGYTLVPAVGPYIVYADRFTVPLKGWFLTNFLTSTYSSGTNYTDVFPSLHVAVSAYLLFFDMKWNRRRFKICLLPCVGIWFSTIYLRYHYFVDVLSGFTLAALALCAAKLTERKKKG
jgi:membrane-associated phospholipid phosphatase